MIYESELYHHGIKGMKWGVRRYQNYDGSYTQRGLERYGRSQAKYDEAKAKSDSSKQAYKSGTGTKEQYQSDIQKTKQAKKELSKSYDKLKMDNKADKGKDLYAKGKTITGNTNAAAIRQTATSLGSAAVYAIVMSKTGNKNLAAVDAAIVAAGGTAVNGILSVKSNSENKKLRAYYGHH